MCDNCKDIYIVVIILDFCDTRMRMYHHALSLPRTFVLLLVPAAYITMYCVCVCVVSLGVSVSTFVSENLGRCYNNSSLQKQKG